jgi:hypothetical protein
MRLSCTRDWVVDTLAARLLYTTGEVSSAVRLFLGLLKRISEVSHPGKEAPENGDQPDTESPNPAKVLLEDFRVALVVNLCSNPSASA